MVRRWGQRDFLSFVLWTGLGAAVVSVIVGYISPNTFGQPIVGISGVVMGLIGALSWTLKDQILGYFFTLPIRAKYVLPIVLAIDLLSWLGDRNSDVAVQTHLGGVLSAWLLMTGNWRPKVVAEHIRLWRVRRGKRKPARQKAPHLRVIDGGKKDSSNDTDDEPPRWLH